ncbi:LCP family protein [Patescibacteria group bacterium]|nr:LCP family protein [Patescibacteria group bacterium]MBU1672970.1 LCP family protein [Patescibacteria group bacterium]MBU1962995.1 LCP family protein [Patescibacteria group bacterium]
MGKKKTNVSKVSEEDLKIETESPAFEGKKRKFGWKKIINKKTIILVAIFIIVLGVGFAYRVYSNTVNNVVVKDDREGVVEQVKNIVQKDEKMLKGQEEDRINVLLLGMGGKNHPGGTLTDTNLIVSIKPSTNETAMISLPRDLVVKVYDDQNPNYWEGRKLNYMYELGGGDLAAEKIEEITGLDINYHVSLDFEGFRKVIDDMGGLDVYVDNPFTDREYPDYNYGYQTIAFRQGEQHMDGETALQYARSRHGNNGEGSDFARAKRQQKIIATAKEKFLTPEVIANPKKGLDILEDLSDHVETNMEVWEMIKFAEIAMNIDRDKIINKVIDNDESGLVYSKIYPQTGAYVLIPTAGEYNFSEIHALASNIFDIADLVKEKAKIEIQNGTLKNGVAAKMATQLESQDMEVVKTGNAKDQTHNVTLIYDLSNGTKPLSLEFLQDQTGAAMTMPMTYEEFMLNHATSEEAPLETEEDSEGMPDFVIILGADNTSV